MSTRRAPAIIVIVALLVALVALGRAGHDQPVPAFGRAQSELAPTADAASATSSTWYCAAGTSAFLGAYNLSVVATNTASVERRGSITWMSGDGKQRKVSPLRLGPHATVATPAVEHLLAPTVSALVELDGGGVAVEHAVNSQRGSAVAPCASRPSSTWYLANGVTERDAAQDLVLFNPFPDDAVVDVSFSTDRGRDEPRALQGLPIAAGTTRAVHLQDVVRRRIVTATSVVARTGRLVVDRVQSFDGSAGRVGMSLALAAPGTAPVWSFPDGLYEPGLTERWHVYNPSDREADATLEIVPATGAVPEPYDFTVPPRTQIALDAAEVQRIFPGVAHSATVRSLNDIGLVAERSIVGVRPSHIRGWSSALGSPVTARRWAFPVGEANFNTDEGIVVHNPGPSPVRVSILALIGGRVVEVEASQDLRVAAAGRIAVRLGDHISRTPLPIFVVATGPVVAERDTYGVSRTGVATIIGIPVP